MNDESWYAHSLAAALKNDIRIVVGPFDSSGNFDSDYGGTSEVFRLAVKRLKAYAASDGVIK